MELNLLARIRFRLVITPCSNFPKLVQSLLSWRMEGWKDWGTEGERKGLTHADTMHNIWTWRIVVILVFGPISSPKSFFKSKFSLRSTQGKLPRPCLARNYSLQGFISLDRKRKKEKTVKLMKLRWQKFQNCCI